MKMAKTFLLMLACAISFYEGYSQKEGNFWFFGNNAGIDFNSGIAVSIPNGQTSTSEGSASVSDVNGNLLFYTDGITVWNKNHLVMTNGTGLGGGASSTQSSVIVRKPGSNNLYYVFTVTENFGTITYSIVDMALNGGNGAVTTKNTFIMGNVAEKICAIHHANKVDYWIVIHNNNLTTYSAFLLTAAGLSALPVNSPGLGVSSSSFIGYLEANGAGTKLAAAFWNTTPQFFLYDFDNATGIVSNSLSLPFHPASSGAYGVEFSPSGRYLYCTLITPGEIRQYDLLAGNNAAILASEVLIGNATNAFNGGMSLAPDGKIYVAQYGTTYLGVINNPDSAGAACNYVDVGFNLVSGTSTLGIPNFPTDIFSVSVLASRFCFGDTTLFSLADSSAYIAISWNFDDPASTNNASYTYLTSHIFTAPGNYNVSIIIVYANATSDTILYPVTIDAKPVFSLGPDTTLCNGQSLVLTPGSYSSYLWQNGSSSATYTATVTGTYFVEVSTPGGCKGNDSIDVTFSPCTGPQAAFSSSDTLWCDKTCIDFYDLSQNSPTSWQWYFTGASPTTSTVQHPTGICYNNYGSFDVILVACNANGCDSLFKSNFVTEFQLPLPPTITFISDTLYASPAYSYQWFNTNNVSVVLSTNNYLVPVVDGSYFVLGFDSNGCATPSATFGFYTSMPHYYSSYSDVTITSGPGNEYFDIHILNGADPEQISVHDIDGKTIFINKNTTSSEDTYRLDFYNVAQGMYFIKVNFDNYTCIRKVVKL